MSDENRDERKRHFGAFFLGLSLLVAFAFAVAIGPARKARVANPVATVSASTVAPLAAGNASQASVVVDNGVVKFYFASGKAELAVGAKQALASIVAGTSAGKQAVVSGFHDASGNAVRNAELAKQRAFAVRDALKALGVPVNKIALNKPVKAQAAGSNDEARRVEVSLK